MYENKGKWRLYNKKRRENPYPLVIPEGERIYFDVPYMCRDLAKYCHCRFDKEKKLWYTGLKNSNLYTLVDFYGVNNKTSEKAKELLKEIIKE